MSPRNRFQLAFAFAGVLIAANWGPSWLAAHPSVARAADLAGEQAPPEIRKVWVYPRWESAPVQACGYKDLESTVEQRGITECFTYREDAFNVVIFAANLRRTAEEDGSHRPTQVFVDGRPVTGTDPEQYPWLSLGFPIDSEHNGELICAAKVRIELVSADDSRSAPIDVDMEAARRAVQPVPDDAPRILDAIALETNSDHLVSINFLATGLATPAVSGGADFVLHPTQGGSPFTGFRSRFPNFVGGWVPLRALGSPLPVSFTIGGRASAGYTLDSQSIAAWSERSHRRVGAKSDWSAFSFILPVGSRPGLSGLVFTLVALGCFRPWKAKPIVRSMLACSVPAVIMAGMGAVFAVMGGLSGILGSIALYGAPFALIRGAVLGALIGLGFKWAREGSVGPTTDGRP